MASKAAQVVTLSGKVTMDAPGVIAKALSANDEVPEGATIKTSVASACKLLFTDDTIMDVGAASEFKIDEYKLGDGHDRKGMFSLAYGTMRSLVSKPVGDKGSYKVKTRDAIMGVRGTEFAVSAPFVEAGTATTSAAAPTSIVVASGTVAMGLGAASPGGASGGTMNVTAGQSFSTAQLSNAGAGTVAAPQPTTMSAGQMQTAMGNARVSDNTFNNAVSMDSKDSSGSASGGGKGGNMTMASAQGAMANTVSVGADKLIETMNPSILKPDMRPPIPPSVPPVNIIPGQQRTLTIIVQ